MTTRALVVAAMLGTAGVASAQGYVEVERERSTAGIVLRDAVSGVLVGSAVSGGIILYEMGINDNDDYNWERTLAWGALIGLGAGLVWGIVDATSAPAVAMERPVVRDGLSWTLDQRRADQSGLQTFEVWRGRF